jgi:ABC-type amino acid transport substrate-binding protein
MDERAHGAETSGLPLAEKGKHQNAVRVADPAPDPELRWYVGIRLLSPDQALMEAVNSSIDGLLAEQTIQGIFSKYGVPYAPPGIR